MFDKSNKERLKTVMELHMRDDTDKLLDNGTATDNFLDWMQTASKEELSEDDRHTFTEILIYEGCMKMFSTIDTNDRNYAKKELGEKSDPIINDRAKAKTRARKANSKNLFKNDMADVINGKVKTASPGEEFCLNYKVFVGDKTKKQLDQCTRPELQHQIVNYTERATGLDKKITFFNWIVEQLPDDEITVGQYFLGNLDQVQRKWMEIDGQIMPNAA